MRVLLFSLTLMLLSSPRLAALQSSSSSRKDIPPATAKSNSPQAVDVATIQALTRLQDKADSIDERLNDLKENMRALLEANNRSVDIVKDLAIAIIGILALLSKLAENWSPISPE